MQVKIPKQYSSRINSAKRVFEDISKTGKWSKPSDLAITSILKKQGHIKELSRSTYRRSGKWFAPTPKGKAVFETDFI